MEYQPQLAARVNPPPHGRPGRLTRALVAVYGRRRRHKARKRSFVIPLWLIAVVHLALLAGAAWLAWKQQGARSPV